MADWFKFYCDGLDSGGMQFCIEEQPLTVSVWILILSECAKNRSATLPWDEQDFRLLGYARKLNISPGIFNQCIALLSRCYYIKVDRGQLHVPGWDKMQSVYARGLDRGYYKSTNKKLASDYIVSTARGEERRGDKSTAEAVCKSPSASARRLFDAWNDLGVVPKCLYLSDKRRRSIEQRLREPFFMDNWEKALDKVKTSQFCQGGGNTGWKANFDWFIRPDSVTRIMEGKYDGLNKTNGSTRNEVNRNAGTYNQNRAQDYAHIGKKSQLELPNPQSRDQNPP